MDEQIRIQDTGISEMIYMYILTKWMKSFLQWFSVSFVSTSVWWWMIIFIVTYNNYPPLLCPLHTIDQSRYLWPEDTCPFPETWWVGPGVEGRRAAMYITHLRCQPCPPGHKLCVVLTALHEENTSTCLTYQLTLFVHPVLKLIVTMYVQPNKCIPMKQDLVYMDKWEMFLYIQKSHVFELRICQEF